MAFNGNLVKLGGSSGTWLPLKYMRYNTYSCEPAQRLDLDSTRDLTGVLHRNVLAHTATVIKFTVPHLTNAEHDTLLDLLRANMSNTHTKTITLYYWNDEVHDYRTGVFYIPDLTFPIRSVDPIKNTILYGEFELQFIEY